MKRSKQTNSSAKSRPRRPRRQTLRELVELQRLMAAAVMRALTPENRMQARWRDGRSMQSHAAAFIKPNARLTSFERLEIYNRQYWFRILDCFYEDYPGLCAILGEQKFARLARAYLSECPSSSFSLRNLGQHLISFIETHPRLVTPHRREALDMARLEWAHVEAFDNEAKPVLSTDDLLDHDGAHLPLRLQPYITLLQLSCAFDDFLISLRQEGGLRSDASNAMENKQRKFRPGPKRALKRETVFLAVHRYRSRVFYKRLDPVQFTLLRRLQAGESIETAVAAISARQRASITPENLRAWFADWSSLGWFWIDREPTRRH